MGPCRRRGSAAGPAGALGCIARSGCPMWVRGSWAALPWLSCEPWRSLWFLNGRVCQKPQSEAAGEAWGARLCPLPGGGSSSPHRPLAARAGGSIHGPTCPREVGQGGIQKCSSFPCTHLLSAGSRDTVPPRAGWRCQGRNRAGDGTRAQGAELCFPSGTIFQACLPSSGSGVCSRAQWGVSEAG